MNDELKTGLLLSEKNIKLHRQWFKEMVKLHGIYVLYRAPRPGKHWTTYAEVDTNFEPPIVVGCLFHDHPDQKTLRKAGWVAELQDNASLIEVEYDLPHLQHGALFIVPSGIDNAKGRLFRVSSMYNSIVYPCSITCEIVPEYEDTANQAEVKDYTNSSFNLISEEKDSENFLQYNRDLRDFGSDDEDFL